MIVGACLVILTADFSRRWGRPRVYLDPRSRVTWGVTAAIAAVLVVVALID